uniref:bifunctional lysine-specific demethylase and histidyl-hydroxylase NO66-like isoform X5 n=1 Tax=Ciona intestinalis TaxID=7719 RepID=UPI000EF55B3B|nr:bifunctional lysine-specific demethylase and histidyl-hydroxylase NO66-like isoform X5 [Ciona intestinalis]|eukprot:XP_026692480.1 bifunctional lysine-specific demethylase and histidyl-hydroxylase NO66-like isoform X5 [Ciona intestinalis]
MDDDSDIVVDDGASDECRVVDDKEVNDEEVDDQEVNDEEVYDEEMDNHEVYDEEVDDQEVYDEEVDDEEVDDLGEVNDSDSDIVVDGETSK